MKSKRASWAACAAAAAWAFSGAALAASPNGVPALEDYPDVFDGFNAQSLNVVGSQAPDGTPLPSRPMAIEARVYAQAGGRSELVSKNDFALRQGQAQTAEKIVSATCFKEEPPAAPTPAEPNRPLAAEARPAMEKVQQGLRLGLLWTATAGSKQYVTVAYKLKSVTQSQGPRGTAGYSDAPNGAVAAELLSVALDRASGPKVVSVARASGGGQWVLVIGTPESFSRFDPQALADGRWSVAR